MLATGLCSVDTRWRPLSIIVGLLPLYSGFFKIYFDFFVVSVHYLNSVLTMRFFHVSRVPTFFSDFLKHF
jgi:hypothetical protein